MAGRGSARARLAGPGVSKPPAGCRRCGTTPGQSERRRPPAGSRGQAAEYRPRLQPQPAGGRRAASSLIATRADRAISCDRNEPGDHGHRGDPPCSARLGDGAADQRLCQRGGGGALEARGSRSWCRPRRRLAGEPSNFRAGEGAPGGKQRQQLELPGKAGQKLASEEAPCTAAKFSPPADREPVVRRDQRRRDGFARYPAASARSVRRLEKIPGGSRLELQALAHPRVSLREPVPRGAEGGPDRDSARSASIVEMRRSVQPTGPATAKIGSKKPTPAPARQPTKLLTERS